jgi:ABC-2 type transport system permease protein
MSTPSDGLPEPAIDARVIAPATLSPTRPLYWSIRRELWDNRSIYIAPMVASAVVLFGLTIGAAITLPNRMGSLSALDPARQQAEIAMPYGIAACLIILASYIVGAFYCVDALHGERRDRSILFWKSLPVSDLTTVLSKAGIPLVVLPLIAFAASLATQLAMLLLSSAILLASGAGPATLWTRLPLFEMSLVMVYGLTVHALWHAPLYGWLLLVSAWAKRMPFLWAVLPPLGLVAIETVAFQTSYACSFVRYRLAGGMEEAFALEGQGGGAIIRLTQLDPLGFLSSPGLWVGLAVAAAFLATAVRLRRRGEPI